MSKSLNTNFHIKAPKPIDARMIVSTYTDLDAIPIKYNHMITHVETTDTDWKYYSATNTWVEVTYNSSTTWGDIIGSIGNQVDLMNEFNKYSLTTHTHPQLPPLPHTHVEANITDLDKYTQEEVTTFLKYKSQVVTGDIVQGLVSINASDASTFDIAAGIGVKTVWAPTSPTTPPVSYQVDYPEMLGISLTNLLTNTATYVGILYDEILDTFSVVQSTTPFSLDARRDVIMKAVIEHPDNAVISKIHNIGNPARLSGQNTQDISLSVGPLNISGNKYSPQGNNLGLNRTTGSIFGVGISFNTPTSPNTRVFSGSTGVSFQHRLQTGEEYGSTTSLEPQYYDNAGVRTVIPINKWSIPRVFLLPDGTTAVQYAQVYYDTFNEALSAIDTENFIVESRLQNAILRSCIIVSSSATNLSDSAEALFVEIDKWGWAKKPGAVGSEGPQGPIGPEGPQGPQGLDGADGEQIIFNPTAANSVSDSGAAIMEVDYSTQASNIDVGSILYVNNADSNVSGYVRVISVSTTPDELGVEWITTNTNSTVGWSSATDIMLTGPQGVKGETGAQGIAGVDGPVGPQGPAGTTDYISSVALVGTSLDFTGVGSAFAGSVSLAGILGSTDYVSNVVLTGNSLNFTGIGSAFNANVDLSGILGASVFTGLTDTPGSLGTAGQVVAVNGAGTALEFINAIGGGLNNIVEDVTPQLGARLDMNGFSYGLGNFIDLTSTFANSFEFQYGGISRISFDIGSSANVLINSSLNAFIFNKPLEATSFDMNGPGTNVMLDNGTVTPLSGLGGGAETDPVFTAWDKNYNDLINTPDDTKYVKTFGVQSIYGQKDFSNGLGNGTSLNVGNGTTMSVTARNNEYDTALLVNPRNNNTGIKILMTTGTTGATPILVKDNLTNVFEVSQDGDVVANSIDIGGNGTEVLLDDGTTTPLKPYVSYVALVSQTGTSNPTAIVLENNLGGTVTFVRGAVGLYTANLTGAFTLDKVAIFLTSSSDNIMSGNYFSTDAVGIQTSDRNGNLADNLFNKTPVEIRVYS